MQSVGKNAKLVPHSQVLQFRDADDNSSFEVHCTDVKILPRSGNHTTGSSKVKLKNIVDFGWEHRVYLGHLVAVHISGKYLAYGIKAGKNPAGMVRVVNRETEDRALIRGMQGMIQDLAFAHIPTQVILACVDELGNLFVHEVEVAANKLVCNLLLHVMQDTNATPSTNHRVIFCPFIPEDDSESADAASSDDVAKLLVLTHDEKAEMWNVAMVAKRYGSGPLLAETVKEGYLQISEHSKPIVDAAFSPDGTALATASLDGEVKFFQVYMQNESKPRCLHEWKPHDGKPLSSLFFLDNHRSYNPEVQFWKFAVTGAQNNSELKLWSCESWTCLQTIRFEPEIGKMECFLKAGLDLGAGYLLLSDIYKRVLYVLQIHQEPAETTAFVCSVAEFPLPCPMLSFGIVDAGLRKFKPNTSFSIEDLTGEDADEDGQQYVPAVVVRMYLVQPKSLQECHIAFQPSSSVPITSKSLSSLSHDSLVFREGFSDLSTSMAGGSVSDLDNSMPDLPANHLSEQPPANRNSQQQQQQSSQLNLMTPDAFSSPAKKDSPVERSPQSLSQVSLQPSDVQNLSSPHIPRILDTSLSSSPTLLPARVSSPEDMIALGQVSSSSPCDDKPLATSELQEPVEIQREGFASGGSSPSREVQEILSVKTGIKRSYFKSAKPTREEIIEPSGQKTPSPSTENEQYEGIVKEKESSNIKPTLETDGWSQIPIMLVDEVRKSVAAEEEHSSKRNPVVPESIPPAADIDLETKSLNIWKLHQRVEGTYLMLNNYLQILQTMQNELKELKNEVQLLQSTRLDSIPAQRLEGLVNVNADKILSKYHQEQSAVIQEILRTRENKERENQETLMSAISQAVGNLVSTKLDEIISLEIKENIMPAVIGTVEPLKHQFHLELTQKLTSTDHLLKENIAKLVHSKSVMDVLSNSMVSALQPAIQECYKDAFTTIVIPCFEKACQNMFIQMNETFARGTREYVQTLETYFEKHKRQSEKGRDFATQLQGLSETVRNNNEQISSLIQKEVHSQMQKAMSGVQDSMLKTLKETVRDQIVKGFKDQQTVIEDSVITAVRSRAVTPSSHIIDAQLQQAQILQLIAQGQINAAFQQALSASDLNLVVFICEKVNPHQVFNQTPCPLQQHVLLSLIQQLSADMGNHTEVKHKYLEEAVMNLDPTNPVTREHMPAVITSLQRQLQTYIANNPNNKVTRSLKMLNMATQALMNT